MHFEEISKFIVPLLFLLYFFSGKKKKKPKRVEERVTLPPPPSREPPQAPRSTHMEARSCSSSWRNDTSPAPIHRKLSRLESAIESRHFPGQIEERRYISPISDERAQTLISTGLSEHIDIDQAYALKPRHQNSRGKAILNQLSSPRDAFILQVIINRYD